MSAWQRGWRSLWVANDPPQKPLPGVFWRLDGVLLLLGLAAASAHALQAAGGFMFVLNGVALFFALLAQVFLVSMPRARGGLLGAKSASDRGIAWVSLLLTPFISAFAMTKFAPGWWTLLQALFVVGLVCNGWLIVRSTRALRASA